ETKATVKYDATFQMTIGSFQNNARFVQRLKVTDKTSFSLQGDVRAQACDDHSCTPPLPIEFSFTSKHLPATITVAETSSENNVSPAENSLSDFTPLWSQDEEGGFSSTTVTVTEVDKDLLWTPVIEELKQFGMKGSTAGMSIFWIFIAGFIGGLIALITPCVWPMIPMTVSFFLKRNKAEKKKAISEAIVYGAAIIVIYMVLGLLITGIFGASALNNLPPSALF